MNKEISPRNTYIERFLIILSIMLGLYFIENSSIRFSFDSYIFNNVLRPVLWGGLILLIWLFPNIRVKGKLKLRGFINLWAFNFAIIFIVVSIVAGLIDGLGKSPYDHSFKGILINIFSIGVVLVTKELARSYLLNSMTKKENYILFIIISIFFAFIGIPFNRFTSLHEFESIVIFIARYAAPEFAKNLFATYLVFWGGPMPSMIYLGFMEGFHWLSPVLPDLKWITTALIGILCPLFSLIMLQNVYLTEAKLINKRKETYENPLGWIVTSIVSIALIWFSVGVFPIYPSVIATGSMEPMIKPGDVILVKRVDANEIQVGDVIQFKSDSILISHRVIEIVEEDGILNFRTKGDNNSIIDTKLVRAEYIKGKVIQVVPKIGWPTLLLKSKDDIPLDDIEF